MMNLTYSLIWMFFGSIIIGIFFNGMNILAYRYSDLYLSLTLVYSALLMAINMCILEIFMYYSHSNELKYNLLLLFIILMILTIFLLREQYFVNDNQWLKRMISHHSTALTTSYKIKNKTNNKKIKKLAQNIIDTQKKEINIMKNLLNN